MHIEALNRVRSQEDFQLNLRNKVCRFILFFLAGAFLGFASKFIEGVPHYGQFGDVLNIIGNIFTGIGIWAFVATIISAFSRSPVVAGMNVFLFFSGVLLAYYLYSMRLFGFFPTYYFLRWGAIAACSLFAAYVVWFSRGEGWIAAICAALPVGLLFEQGYGYLSIYSGINLFGAFMLIVILPKKKLEVIKIIPLAIAVAVIFIRFRILLYLIGGM